MYVFVACLLVSVAWAGPCSFAGVGTNWYATSQPVEEPESCEWYESDSCCKPTFDVDLGTLEDASEDCKDFLRSVLCASCSPSSAIFASTNNQGFVLSFVSLKQCVAWYNSKFASLSALMDSTNARGPQSMTKWLTTSPVLTSSACLFFTGKTQLL